MTILVNGEEVTVESDCTVSTLLARFDLAESPCAVEVNARVVPRRSHGEHVLSDGDTVEVVTLVGGG